MSKRALLWTSATWFQLSGAAARARRQCHAGAYGTRIALFHNVYPHEFDRFRAMIERLSQRFEMVGPAQLDALQDGQVSPATRDRLAISFDDGNDNQFEAAAWLADQGIRALLFIVPPFLERTTQQFVDYHAQHNVAAFPLGRRAKVQPQRGMARSQVRELVAMGHRIGAHNFAHRNLGELQAPSDLDYEIGNALEAIAELTGQPCEDFAVGFGHWKHLGPTAAHYLQERCRRVYMAFRGLNHAGHSPAFFCRTQAAPSFPVKFAEQCLSGALDLRDQAERQAVLDCVGRLGQARAVVV